MSELDQAIERYRARPTKENHEILSLAQEVEHLRRQITRDLEEMWDRP